MKMNGSAPFRNNASRRGGQSAVELAVLLSVVVAALVGMQVYFQRGYQGYLRANASAQGAQFDPTQPFSGTQTMNGFSQAQQIEIEATEPNVTLPQGSSQGLPNVPGGQLPGRVLRTKATVTTDWDISREASHDAR